METKNAWGDRRGKYGGGVRKISIPPPMRISNGTALSIDAPSCIMPSLPIFLPKKPSYTHYITHNLLYPTDRHTHTYTEGTNLIPLTAYAGESNTGEMGDHGLGEMI